MRSLLILIFISGLAGVNAQEAVPYGNNPAAGQYFEVDGTKLYYEVYGSGEPLLMLHGGVYGYIDEFTPLIPNLAEQFQVICLATRGHGKSEIGHDPYTYFQRADDAYQLIQHLQLKQVRVVGFSDGGTTALYLAAHHPDMIKKVVAMGVGEIPESSRTETFNYTSESLLAESGDYFKSRLALMPEPERWNECLQMLNGLYNGARLDKAILGKIDCPTLLMNGDHDQYYTVDAVVRAYHELSKGTLSVIPGCGHVIFYCNLPAVLESMLPFLKA